MTGLRPSSSERYSGPLDVEVQSTGLPEGEGPPRQLGFGFLSGARCWYFFRITRGVTRITTVASWRARDETRRGQLA